MLVDVEFSSWEYVKKTLLSNPEIVLFDVLNFDRLLIVKPVNTYEWNDCLETLEINLDDILGGCWASALRHTIHLTNMIKHHENKGKN